MDTEIAEINIPQLICPLNLFELPLELFHFILDFLIYYDGNLFLVMWNFMVVPLRRWRLRDIDLEWWDTHALSFGHLGLRLMGRLGEILNLACPRRGGGEGGGLSDWLIIIIIRWVRFPSSFFISLNSAPKTVACWVGSPSLYMTLLGLCFWLDEDLSLELSWFVYLKGR